MITLTMSCVIMVISKLQDKIKITIPHTAVEEKDRNTHTNTDQMKGLEDMRAMYQCKCQCPSPNVPMNMRQWVGTIHTQYINQCLTSPNEP